MYKVKTLEYNRKLPLRRKSGTGVLVILEVAAPSFIRHRKLDLLMKFQSSQRKSLPHARAKGRDKWRFDQEELHIIVIIACM